MYLILLAAWKATHVSLSLFVVMYYFGCMLFNHFEYELQ